MEFWVGHKDTCIAAANELAAQACLLHCVCIPLPARAIWAASNRPNGGAILTEILANHCAQVLAVQLDGHTLFRQAQAVRAVIVCFPKGRQGPPPTPTMLAASLRRKKPMDE